ncbi:MAG: hypothetical protein ACOYM3_33110, partial [Terrimicrobiaceae bacterium]
QHIRTNIRGLLTANYILLYYTVRMKNETDQAAANSQEITWQPTQYANIVRHVPSGIYYARLRIKGKLIWRSLKTDKISIAKLRMGDVEVEERKKAEVGYIKTKDKILI